MALRFFCSVFEEAPGAFRRGANWNSHPDYEELKYHKFVLDLEPSRVCNRAKGWWRFLGNHDPAFEPS